MGSVKAKNYAETFLYGKGNYERNITEFIVKSEIVDKQDSSFDNVRFEVKKRQTNTCICKVLDAPNVVLLIGKTQLPRTFKVFAARDIKSGSNTLKVFIDVTSLIIERNGEYNVSPRDTDILISYLVSAMNTLIYYADPSRVILNSDMIKFGTICFAHLFTYIIDYLRIGNVDKVREKTLYLSSIYYQVCLLSLENDQSNVKSRAIKISGLNKREAEIVDILTKADAYENINTFINALAIVLKTPDLRVDNFMEKWIQSFYSGTNFAVEMYPAFSTMLTDAYIGSYRNNQKLIEKLCGKEMVDYTNALFKVGSELLK